MNQSSTKSCLVVIDMINGFIQQGPLADPSIASIIGSIETLIKQFKQHDWPIIALVDQHREDAKEFQAFPAHCIKASEESELVDQLKPYQQDMVMLAKNSVNGFLAPDFIAWFEQQPSYKQYVITGCVTDICVLSFAMTLQAYIHQHQLDSEVIVVADGVDTFTTLTHDKATYHNMALAMMKQIGISIKLAKELYD